MPKIFKKCTKQKLDLKQKKLLKARLIRISMVIDDYLYKNEAILPKDANAYVEEVSNYKLIFEKDDRSLQVIEKITRCMNAIIVEQQEENDETVNIQNTSENYCPSSPVYSLPDEDKTMLTQVSTNLNPNMECEGNNVNDFDTVYLCDEDEDNIQRNIQVDVEIYRAMSSLSIRENEHSQDMHIVDSSQSILMDFNANKEEEIKKTSKDSTKVKIPKPKLFVPPNVQTSVVNDCSQSLLKEFNPKVAELSTGTRNIPKEAHPEINYKAPTKLNTVSNKYIISKDIRTPVKKTVQKNARFSNNIETIDMTDDTEHKKRGGQMRKRATKAVDNVKRKISTVNQSKKSRKEKTSKNTAVYQEPIKIPATTSNKSTVDISVAKTNKIHTTLPLHKINTSLNETVYQKKQSNNICELNKVNNSSYNKSMAKIYNTNIENDLSWMENIRFVREVLTDEFDPKYASLPDIFWENFELPTEWNDKDFDYFAQ